MNKPARTRGLSVTSLSAGYPRKDVIRDLTLPCLLAGQMMVLVGPNAAGKSTLLRALAGLIPARGSIRLDDVELNHLGRERRAELIGFMPQSIPTGAHLSVLESVICALRILPLGGAKISASSAERRAIQVLERLGIADLALDTLDALSGGQRQLVNLAQAIVREPRLLLLDEPTGALDMRHQIRVMKAARRLAETGHIVVMVLHDLAIAARWADRIVVLQDGAIAADGPPSDVITPRMLASVYGIEARIEACSAGRLQILVDDLTPSHTFVPPKD